MSHFDCRAAKELLLNNPERYATREALRNLAAQVSTFTEGEVTVLYSGWVNDVHSGFGT
ncbi:hypothetical protein [Pseudomonas sp. GD03944]|uniref:hypothetical protein n=1 Tax=Pseudomonas sp. GD03944 TaxID=2975409 RepID=UPI0024492BF5|nr:hypothetical protein [Pseudomonas sp. GD03944]MDH1261624.1 hypothetical protein [Pseudomonas sp. GD03944]